MNAAHNKPSLTDISAPTALETRRRAMSSLVDGELEPAAIEALLEAYGDSDDACADWQTYHLIGDVLRGSPDPVLPARAAQEFVATFNERLRSEPGRLEYPETGGGHVRAPAANDATFRWKLVAGLASMVAAVALGWGVIGSPAAPFASGPQLAMGSVPSPALDAPVVVQTAQGQVLRDARLEELLAEHRQYGGMSALQMPAGFLRNATYDTAPQR